MSSGCGATAPSELLVTYKLVADICVSLVLRQKPESSITAQGSLRLGFLLLPLISLLEMFRLQCLPDEIVEDPKLRRNA